MIRRPPRSTQSRSSAASDVYKRQAPPTTTASRTSGDPAGGSGRTMRSDPPQDRASTRDKETHDNRDRAACGRDRRPRTAPCAGPFRAGGLLALPHPWSCAVPRRDRRAVLHEPVLLDDPPVSYTHLTL